MSARRSAVPGGMAAHIDVGPYQLTLRPLPVLAAAAGLALLVALGVWQLQRGADKQAVLVAYQALAQAAPVALQGDERSVAALQQHPVSASGGLDAVHQFLLDNRTRRGQVGYEVLVPLRFTGSEAAVLVNRGWLARGPERTSKPALDELARPASVRGRAVQPTVGFHLGEMLEPGSDWPHIVQFIALPRMQQLLGYPLLPVVIQLDSGDPLALVTDWPVPAGPARHYAYALQWFGMAAVLLAVCVAAGTRRRA